MTRQEFIAEFRHEIDGWVLDAALMNRSGSEQSIFLRMIRTKIELKLGAMYDTLLPASKPNGKKP